MGMWITLGRVWMGAILVLLSAGLAQATPHSIQGDWYLVSPYHNAQSHRQFLADPLNQKYAAVNAVSPIGGHYLYIAPFEIHKKQSTVFDFKNTSTIEYFQHQVYDEQGREVARLEGGIGRQIENPFFLRHGRSVTLAPGKYVLATQVISTNYLAIPEPYLQDQASYMHAIKRGNALTLFGLGIFWALGIYYTVLAASRNRSVEAMYAIFIAGNFIYNSAALLVLPDLLNVHSIYLVSMPVLLSSMAYILFVMHLLEINRYQHKRLYYAGVGILLVMLSFLLMAMLLPNWALEFCRYEVALFLCYGLAAAIRQSQRKNATAKRYLIAISLFFVSGIITISLSRLHEQFDLYIEHLGLVSVALEVILLALVLAFQFSQLQKEKENALEALGMTEKVANSDALTSLPNRYAFVKELEQMTMQGSLTFIDLDGLKFYNDQHGHARGDELLVSFAKNYQHYLGSQLVLYRLGGDEFAVLSHKGEVAVVERALQDAIEGVRREGFEFFGASAGSAYYYEADNKPELLHLADERMYEKKRSRQQR
jgi:diguanylate cyclase (GGDEF)-like protein